MNTEQASCHHLLELSHVGLLEQQGPERGHALVQVARGVVVVDLERPLGLGRDHDLGLSEQKRNNEMECFISWHRQ